ncbi:piggyBac transposable element-derived protein 4-like [Scomber scombrus]|uniref:PiggyBac transposable element-derived protein 4-like n=1 Tax=Scomber scombrus TaxID=13677 RepID=A0AAV1PWW4_SCOSC
MQVYTGKPIGGAVERNQGMRVVLDVTKGLTGRNVTCDNLFTSYELGQRLLHRDMTMVGTVRQNKPELPAALFATKGRELFSSTFAFTGSTAVVCYIPKRNKKVLLMSTRHKEATISERRDRKPALVLDYNSNKGGVDNLDKVIGTYSCRRMTARWPLAVFHNIIDVSSYNAFVIWREMNPAWLSGKRSKRTVFLERLGKQLVAPLIQRRVTFPRTVAAANVVRAVQAGGEGGTGRDRDEDEDDQRPAIESPAARAQKRRRCEMCTEKKDRKTRLMCRSCRRYICGGCSVAFCSTCAGALQE